VFAARLREGAAPTRLCKALDSIYSLDGTAGYRPRAVCGDRIGIPRVGGMPPPPLEGQIQSGSG